MINDLLKANSYTNEMPYVAVVKLREAMTQYEAEQLCAELLTDHKVRLPVAHVKYLGEDLVKWLNEHSGGWRVVRMIRIRGDQKVTLHVALGNDAAACMFQLMV